MSLLMGFLSRLPIFQSSTLTCTWQVYLFLGLTGHCVDLIGLGWDELSFSTKDIFVFFVLLEEELCAAAMVLPNGLARVPWRPV